MSSPSYKFNGGWQAKINNKVLETFKKQTRLEWRRRRRRRNGGVRTHARPKLATVINPQTKSDCEIIVSHEIFYFKSSLHTRNKRWKWLICYLLIWNTRLKIWLNFNRFVDFRPCISVYLKSNISTRNFWWCLISAFVDREEPYLKPQRFRMKFHRPHHHFCIVFGFKACCMV